MAILLYGAGLRLLEAARVRVKDVDFARNQIMVRGGKGDKDRATPLPSVVIADLAKHLEGVKRQHDADLRHGAGWVELPWALARKYPNAGREWAWLSSLRITPASSRRPPAAADAGVGRSVTEMLRCFSTSGGDIWRNKI